MRKYLLLLPALMGLNSCGNNTQPKEDATDSSVSTTVATSRTIETDSGKLVLTKIQGEELETGELFDASGTLRGKGTFFNGIHAGAWIRYNEKGQIISAVHYSEGKVLLDLDEKDFDIERISLNKMGISMEFPIEWKKVESPNEGNLVTFEKPITESGIMVRPSVNIAKGQLQPGQTLEKLAEEQLQMLHSTVGRVEKVDEFYFSVDSCKAFRRYGMYYAENNKMGFLDAIIISGNELYVISCAAQNREQGEFLKYQAVFENIVKSFRRI